MHEFFYTVRKAIAYLTVCVLALYGLMLGWNEFVNYDHHKTRYEIAQRLSPVKTFWGEMEQYRRNPQSVNTTNPQLRLLAADVDRVLRGIKQNEELSSRFHLEADILLTSKNYQKVSAGILKYVFGENYGWYDDQPNSITKEVRSADEEVRKTGADTYITRLTTDAHEYRYAPWFGYTVLVNPYIWVGVWTIVGLLLCWGLLAETTENYRWKEKGVADNRALPALNNKKGLLLLSVLNPPFGLGMASWVAYRVSKENAKQPKHPYRKEIREAEKLLGELNKLEPTDAVIQRRQRVQEALEYFRKQPFSIDDKIAEDTARIKKETHADKAAVGLDTRIEQLFERKVDVDAKQEIHTAA